MLEPTYFPTFLTDREEQAKVIYERNRRRGACVPGRDGAWLLGKDPELVVDTEAHARVKDACTVAVSKDLSLIEIIKKQYGEIAPGNKIDWDALAKPESYLGQAEQFIDRVLEQAKKKNSINEWIQF